MPDAWKNFSFRSGVVTVELWYPPYRDQPDPVAERGEREADKPLAVEVGLIAVRAADSIRIEYDYDRDGYVIKQASKFEFEAGEVHDQDWQEVAFVQAWGREQRPTERST